MRHCQSTVFFFVCVYVAHHLGHKVKEDHPPYPSCVNSQWFLYHIQGNRSISNLSLTMHNGSIIDGCLLSDALNLRPSGIYGRSNRARNDACYTVNNIYTLNIFSSYERGIHAECDLPHRRPHDLFVSRLPEHIEYAPRQARIGVRHVCAARHSDGPRGQARLLS